MKVTLIKENYFDYESEKSKQKFQFDVDCNQFWGNPHFAKEKILLVLYTDAAIWNSNIISHPFSIDPLIPDEIKVFVLKFKVACPFSLGDKNIYFCIKWSYEENKLEFYGVHVISILAVALIGMVETD